MHVCGLDIIVCTCTYLVVLLLVTKEIMATPTMDRTGVGQVTALQVGMAVENLLVAIVRVATVNCLDITGCV